MKKQYVKIDKQLYDRAMNGLLKNIKVVGYDEAVLYTQICQAFSQVEIIEEDIENEKNEE